MTCTLRLQHDDSPGFERNFVSRTLAFYNEEMYEILPDDKLAKIDAPNSANKSVVHDHLLLELREPLEYRFDETFKAGSLLIANYKELHGW